MPDFVEVAKVEEVPPGTGNCFTVSGVPIALFNVEGAVYAIENSCQHKGASLGTGRLEGKVVTCRAHGWRYDVTTGSTMHVPGFGVASYPVKVEDGKILVDVTNPIRETAP